MRVLRYMQLSLIYKNRIFKFLLLVKNNVLNKTFVFHHVFKERENVGDEVRR